MLQNKGNKTNLMKITLQKEMFLSNIQNSEELGTFFINMIYIADLENINVQSKKTQVF